MQVLKELSKSSNKVHILRKHDCEGLRTLLKLTYDKTDTYGIKCVGSWLGYVNRDTYLQPAELVMLKMFKNRILTGGKAQRALNDITAKYGNLIKLVLNRDLECGIAATTVNKAFPGLIPQFKIQKAKEVPLADVVYPCVAELKYDGARFIGIHRNGRTTFRTSNGKHINALGFAAQLSHIESDFMMDGELVYKEGKMSGRSVASGRLTSAMTTGTLNETDLNWFVFDYMPLANFDTKICTAQYANRRLQALGVILNLAADPTIFLSVAKIANSEEEVLALASNLYIDGYEGLILKSNKSLYEFKRSKAWVKLKQTKTADLECFDYDEHSKDEFLIGSLRLRGTVEGKSIEVSVGSGLNDIDRHRDPDYYLGRTIEIKYNSLVQDHRTSKWSLFLPRYVIVRTDK